MEPPTKKPTTGQAHPVVRFVNCNILRDHKFMREDLWIQNGKIINPCDQYYGVRKPADVIVDCKGGILAPGFIDVQINGGFGIDFSSFEKEDKFSEGLDIVAKGLLAHGVTSFCPTLVTSRPEVYHTVIPKLAPRLGGKDGAAVLGAHLEGPFINPDKNGAHKKDLIRSCASGVDALKETYGEHWENVAMVTVAPELPGTDKAITFLRDKGIIVSMGHSMAHLADGEAGISRGASCVTHLFNAMAAFHHRDPGLVGLLAYGSVKYELFYGLIVDGFHTHEASLKLAHSMHPKGCVLVTDAIAAMGLEPGELTLGDMLVNLDEKHKCTVKGTETLAGSAAPMSYCVKQFAAVIGKVEALEAASLHPAQLMKIEKSKGHLGFGADADLVLLSPDMDLLATYIAGECVWAAN